MSWMQRSPVRIVFAAAPIVAFLIGVSSLAAALGLDPTGAVVPLIGAAGTLALYIIYVRWVERRPIVELSGAGAAGELGRGAVLGALLFAATIGGLWAIGAAEISRGNGSEVGLSLSGAVAAAVVEEILFRAILFRLVERSLGTWLALAVSAALFGAIHAFNHGATVVSTIAIALEAGVLLAAAFATTRRLWLPFGLHAAWNFTEGGVFGARVSGGARDGLLASRFDGTPWITGGEFGPEASILAIAICLTAGIALLIAARRRGQFLPPWWRRDPRLRQV
jgi:membrane protease YdiL (CAAX protease family)